MRQLKLKRSRSREVSAERVEQVAAPEPRRVTIIEQESVVGEAVKWEDDMNSIAPQPSIPSQVPLDEIKMEKGPAAKTPNSNNLSEKTQTDTPEQSKDFINVSNMNPRF
jgi:hypothetical protein